MVVALSVSNGTLALENSRVAVATLNPHEGVGASSYGPLKYRVNAKGAASDWQPLADARSAADAQGARVSRDPGGRVQAVGL